MRVKESHLKDLLRRFIRYRMETDAKAHSQRFWCASLAGEAEHSLSILCDMTVTCCVDSHSSDTAIGNFNDQSLDECINGPAAQRLKHSLAQGRLPLLNCVFCRSLRRCPSDEAERREKERGVPRRDLLVENTVLCNLGCQDCPRLSAVKLRTKMTHSTGEMEKIAREASRYGIEQISFLGEGEPFLASNVFSHIQTLRRHNPKAEIITSTNGTMIDTDERREAALLLDEVMFSIHGCTDESVERYQKKGSFTAAYNNMKDLVALRNARRKSQPIVEWKYVLFRWNDSVEMIRKAVRLAEEAGVDRISFWPTTRPVAGLSWRWYFGRSLRKFGERSSKGLGRQVSFPSSCPAPPVAPKSCSLDSPTLIEK